MTYKIFNVVDPLVGNTPALTTCPELLDFFSFELNQKNKQYLVILDYNRFDDLS